MTARWLGLAAFFAVGVGWAMPAEASSLYQIEVSPEVYRPLPLDGGTTTAITPNSTTDGWAAVPMPFPFTFFGVEYSTMYVTTESMVMFSTPTSSNTERYTNQVIPSSTFANNLIALWWRDQTCNAGTLLHQVLGQAPARTWVIQMHCTKTSGNSTNLAEAQLWLYEGSTTIDTRYGTIGSDTGTYNTTIGIENADGTVAFVALGCNKSCNREHFPAGKKIVYSQPPDVVARELVVSPIVYAGVDIPIQVEIANAGGKPAEDVEVQFWLGRQATRSQDDLDLGRSDLIVNLDAGESQGYQFVASVPRALEPGSYFILAEADPDQVVANDGDRANNVVSREVILGTPTADLAVGSIALPFHGIRTGESFDLEWELKNVGNLETAEVPYQVVVSDNDVISSTDRVLARGSASIGELETKTVLTQIDVPADLRTGLFYLGIIVDPAGLIHELSKENNVGATSEPVSFMSLTGTIETPSRLEAEPSTPWFIALEANGGDGFFAWSLESGELPPGLSLKIVRDGQGRPLYSGIEGVPTAVGTFSFTLRVRSADWSDVRAFEVTIRESGANLVTIGKTLPSASFGIAYEGQLLAVGGSAPYAWSLIGGALPPGLALSSSGKVRGTPLKDGLFSATVSVVDLAGRQAEGTVEIIVGPPGTLTCVTDKLPNGRVGVEIDPTALIAAGGMAPYTFTNRDTRRLANGTSDSGYTFSGQAPPGLHLAADGSVSGTPLEAGRYAWFVEAKDAKRNSDVCVISYTVSYDQGPAILTTSLNDGYVDTPYTAELKQFGADDSATWSLAAGSRLPEGLTLSPDGRISGMPSLSSLEGDAVRIFPFVVQVKDGANREALESLSIRIFREPPKAPPVRKPKEEGGCQAAGGELSLMAMAGAAAHLLRRRRTQAD